MRTDPKPIVFDCADPPSNNLYTREEVRTFLNGIGQRRVVDDRAREAGVDIHLEPVLGRIMRAELQTNCGVNVGTVLPVDGDTVRGPSAEEGRSLNLRVACVWAGPPGFGKHPPVVVVNPKKGIENNCRVWDNGVQHELPNKESRAPAPR